MEAISIRIILEAPALQRFKGINLVRPHYKKLLLRCAVDHVIKYQPEQEWTEQELLFEIIKKIYVLVFHVRPYKAIALSYIRVVISEVSRVLLIGNHEYLNKVE